MRLSVKMMRACNDNYVLKIFYNLFSKCLEYPPLGVSDYKSYIFTKKQVSHKKS